MIRIIAGNKELSTEGRVCTVGHGPAFLSMRWAWAYFEDLVKCLWWVW